MTKPVRSTRKEGMSAQRGDPLSHNLKLWIQHLTCILVKIMLLEHGLTSCSTSKCDRPQRCPLCHARTRSGSALSHPEEISSAVQNCSQDEHPRKDYWLFLDYVITISPHQIMQPLKKVFKAADFSNLTLCLIQQINDLSFHKAGWKQHPQPSPPALPGCSCDHTSAPPNTWELSHPHKGDQVIRMWTDTSPLSCSAQTLLLILCLTWPLWLYIHLTLLTRSSCFNWNANSHLISFKKPLASLPNLI